MLTVVLCADDYAQSDAISQGILDLLAKERLCAVSCMTNSPHWLRHAEALSHHREKVDLGLHFTLTYGHPLTTMCQGHFPALKKLLISAYLRQLNQRDVERELHAQLDQFEKGVGCLPDFVDGHEHVHQFPVIRDALIAVYERRLRSKASYIRVTTNGITACLRSPAARLKTLTITLLGGVALKRKLIRERIPHNTSFSGIYDFSPTIAYANLFRQFLTVSRNQGLIMCHPGYLAEDKSDPIAVSRWREYQYFASQDFLDSCQRCGVGMQRMRNSPLLW